MKRIESIENLSTEQAVMLAVRLSLMDIDKKVEAAALLGAKVGAEAASGAAAKTAIKLYERERGEVLKKHTENICRDVKVLLKNYRRLTDYCQNAVADIESIMEADEDWEGLMRSYGLALTEGEIRVESIKKSYLLTRWLMGHINAALKAFRARCESSGKEEVRRRWRVINALYIEGEPLSTQEAAEAEYVDQRTIYRDIDAAAEELAFDIFGVGAIYAV